MGSPSRNVQYHPPRLSEDRLNPPQPHSPSLPTHCSGKSGMRPPGLREVPSEVRKHDQAPRPYGGSIARRRTNAARSIRIRRATGCHAEHSRQGAGDREPRRNIEASPRTLKARQCVEPERPQPKEQPEWSTTTKEQSSTRRTISARLPPPIAATAGPGHSNRRDCKPCRQPARHARSRRSCTCRGTRPAASGSGRPADSRAPRTTVPSNTYSTSPRGH